MDGGACWAAVHGVDKSRIRLSDFTFTFYFHALEKEIATHSSVLAWRIPGTGEPGGAAIYGFAQSQTQLKRLSSSSSHFLLQGIFLTQELNLDLLHCWQTLLPSEPNLQPIQTGYGKKCVCVCVCVLLLAKKQFETCLVLILLLSTTENSHTQ